MAPSIDRISRLSDDVICHILSFLPTKTSVSTGVLARRWRFLWTHVPSLYFVGCDPKGKTHSKGETQDSDIIHRVLLLHQARTIHTFHLSVVKCTDFQLATWLTHAVKRGVRNLCIYFEDDTIGHPDYLTLPRCLFTCKTLVDAKLHCCRGIPSSGNVFLPCLKKLNLSECMFAEDGSLSQLLSGCPVLEDLIVQWCYRKQNGDDDDDDDLGLIFVSSPTIKSLDVALAFGCHKLNINAPSLVCLYVNDCCLEDITSLTTMTSLIEAHINLMGVYDDFLSDIIDIDHDNAIHFLNSLCNVKCLKFTIDEDGKGMSIAGLDSLVKFDNLTKLEFDLRFDFDEIVKFLEVADNLQVLTFTLRGMHDAYIKPKQVPTCLLSRLKTVQIELSGGFNARDFKTIRYLLRNALVLETMELRYYSYLCSKKKRLGMLRRIPLLEKGSESCQLVLY